MKRDEGRDRGLDTTSGAGSGSRSSPGRHTSGHWPGPGELGRVLRESGREAEGPKKFPMTIAQRVWHFLPRRYPDPQGSDKDHLLTARINVGGLYRNVDLDRIQTEILISISGLCELGRSADLAMRQSARVPRRAVTVAVGRVRAH